MKNIAKILRQALREGAKEKIKELLTEDIQDDCQKWYQGFSTEYNNFMNQCCDTQEGCTTYPQETCGAWASTAAQAVAGLDPCECCDVEVPLDPVVDCSAKPNVNCWVCHGDPQSGGSCKQVNDLGGNAGPQYWINTFGIPQGFTFDNTESSCLAAGPECGPKKPKSGGKVPTNPTLGL